MHACYSESRAVAQSKAKLSVCLRMDLLHVLTQAPKLKAPYCGKFIMVLVRCRP